MSVDEDAQRTVEVPPAADAEIIHVAAAGLDRLGLTDYQVVIGHIGIAQAFLADLALDERVRDRLTWSMEDLRRPDEGRVHQTLGTVLPPSNGAGTEALLSIGAHPGWSALPPETPSAIRTLLRRCLEKDQAKRIADAATVSFVLEESASLSSATAPVSHEPYRRNRYALVAAVAALLGAAATGTIVSMSARPSEAQRVVRLSHSLSSDDGLGSGRHQIGISPTGQRWRMR